MKKVSQLVFLCAFLLTTLSGCAALYRNIEAPAFQLVSIATPGVQPDMSLLLTTRLRISNPNAVALPVKGGALRLSINGVDIGEAVIEDGFNIPANGSDIVALPARIDLRKALEVGISTLGMGTTQIDYAIKGHIDLGTRYLGRVPVSESGTVELGRNGR